MSSKKMPQEHRISGLLPGEVEWINNNHGRYLLIHVPFAADEERYDFEFPDYELVMAAVDKAIMTEMDAVNDAVDERNSKYQKED